MSSEWPEWLAPGERSFFLATCLAEEENASVQPGNDQSSGLLRDMPV